MPLDSDESDADSKMNVEFYTNTTKDALDREGNKKTNNEGKPYVRIWNPGDKTSIFDQPAQEWHMKRYPRHWLAYQMAQQGDLNVPLGGTSLEQWNAEQPGEFVSDQMRELQILGFRTVEQVALASDHQMQRVGMGGPGVRERARRYLDSRNRSDAEIKLEATEKRLAEMEAMVAQLVQNGSIQADPPRRGRPPKSKDVSDVHDDDAPVGSAGDERTGYPHP